MSQQFQDRDQTIENLAMDYYLRGKLHDTATICTIATFKGCDAILQLLATFYFSHKQWKDTQKILSALLSMAQGDKDVHHKRLQMLAEVCFALGMPRNIVLPCSRTVRCYTTYFITSP
jgi:hypothetical protein